MTRKNVGKASEPEVLTIGDIAKMLKVQPHTITAYRSRGAFPPADGQVGRTPWWKPDTIETWQANRPGRWGGKKEEAPTNG